MNKKLIVATSLAALIAVGHAYADDRTVEGMQGNNGVEATDYGKVQSGTTTTGTWTLTGEYVDNSAVAAGGAVANFMGRDGANMQILNAVFRGNKVTGTPVDDNKNSKTSIDGGGALFVGSESNTNIEGTKFIGNESTVNGGAIATRAQWKDGVLKEEKTATMALTISGSSFERNHAGWNGGAIYNTFNGIEISDTDFAGNTAVEAGGALWNNGKEVSITGGNFSGNKATKSGSAGGAIYNTADGDLTISGGTVFANNEADYGGAINSSWFKADSSVKGDNGKISISDGVSFVGNKAKNGGAIRNQNELDIDDVVFSGNVANNGGAIWNGSGANADVSIANSVFSGNRVTGDGTATGGLGQGGAITNGSGTMTFTGTNTFANNSASQKGGAIYNNGTLEFDGDSETVFSGNTAGGKANDVHNDGTMTVDGSMTLGGGIAGTGSLTVGGDLYVGTSTVEQSSIDFSGGNVHVNLVNANNYGKLKADSITAGTVTIDKVATAADYAILDGEVSGDATTVLGEGAGALFNAEMTDGVLAVSAKSAAEIAEGVGVSVRDGAILGAFATNGKLAAMSLAAQDIIENDANAAATIARENGKLNPNDAPVLHTVATQLQTQALDLASDRMSGEFAGNHNVWAQGLYGSAKYSGEFDTKTAGIAAGFDTRITKDVKAGLAYAYNQTDVDATYNTMDVDSHSIFAYAQYKPADWYVNAVAHYTMSDYSDQATAYGVALDSSFKTNAFGGQIAAGYDTAFGLTPELAVRYMHVSADDYDNGVADIKLGDADFVTGVIGARYALDIDAGNGLTIRPAAKAAATYDMLSDGHTATVKIAGADAYDIDLDTLGRFGGEFGLSVGALYKGFELAVGYDLDVRSSYTSHTGKLKFKYEF